MGSLCCKLTLHGMKSSCIGHEGIMNGIVYNINIHVNVPLSIPAASVNYLFKIFLNSKKAYPLHLFRGNGSGTSQVSEHHSINWPSWLPRSFVIFLLQWPPNTCRVPGRALVPQTSLEPRHLSVQIMPPPSLCNIPWLGRYPHQNGEEESTGENVEMRQLEEEGTKRRDKP